MILATRDGWPFCVYFAMFDETKLNAMKKLLLLSTFIFLLSVSAFAQDEYKASNGITYHVGDTVKLGRGAAPNGDFLYLQMGGWAAVMSYNASAGTSQHNIGKLYANTGVVIKKIRSAKVKGIKKYYFTVGGGNITNYLLYIDDAIQTCEVTPCNDPKNVQVVTQSDNLDKIKKLKGLLDAGAITQAEYDAQKSKLLAQ